MKELKSSTAVALIFGMLSLVALAACETVPLTAGPEPGVVTATRSVLLDLPAPRERVAVAVYGFPDLTGQYKASETISSYSRAVSQGGASVLASALSATGRGGWFQVVERESLQNLLTERQIIRETRQQYRTPNGEQLPPPPPLLYAGVVLTGGIIGYDSNVVTGGAGARYFGLGGDGQYRQDTVTIYLRAVSTQSGEVLATVTAQKSILSVQIEASIFRYLAYQRLLEAEMGITHFGILLSEKDSIVYPNALAPELRQLTDSNRVHRVPDYTGASKEERHESRARRCDAQAELLRDPVAKVARAERRDRGEREAAGGGASKGRDPDLRHRRRHAPVGRGQYQGNRRGPPEGGHEGRYSCRCVSGQNLQGRGAAHRSGRH